MEYYREKSEEKLLESSKIFSIDEIRNISTRRKNFESRLVKNEKQDFVLYIKSEIILWNRISSKSHVRERELLKPIVIRIVKLHTLALSYYKDDLKLWLSYIQFCMQAECCSLVSDALKQMLTYHTDKKLWLLAAKWEMDENNDKDKALEFLYKGLTHHPKANSIYMEIFKIELESPVSTTGNDAARRNNHQVDTKISVKILAQIKQEFPDDIDLYLKLLNIATEIATEQKFTIKIQSEIIEYMLQKFSHNEELWHCLGQRELNGHHIADGNQYEFISSETLRVRNMVEKFKYATRLIKTESMWSKYINSILELYENKTETNEQFLKEIFMAACKDAHTVRLMSEEHYMVWLECLENEPKLLQILTEATVSKPNYHNLWMARIRYHLTRNEENKIDSIFEEAINALGDQSIEIWRMKIQYYQLNSHDKLDVVLNLYREGLKSSPTVSKLLKPQFLDWLVLFKNIETGRTEYESLGGQEPYSVDLHKKMADLEAMCPVPNHETLVLITKLAMKQFRQTWIDCLNEEIECGPQWKKDVYNTLLKLAEKDK